MLKQDKPLQSRVDNLILHLQDRKNPPRSACPPSVLSARSAALAITPEERTYLNQKIDLLLSGDYLLDSLEPSVIPKFELLLRERKPRLTANHDYDKAAQIDRNLAILSELRAVQRKRVCDTEHLRELISDLQTSLDAVEGRRAQRHSEHVKIRGRMDDDRRRASEVTEDDHSRRLAKLSEELEDIEMGVGFHPSARLCDLRTVQAKLARNSAFVESAEMRDIADAVEAGERAAFDAEMRHVHAVRARAAEEEHTAKVRTHEEFWDEKMGGIDRAHAKEEEDTEREEASYRKRIAELEKQIEEAPDMDDPVTPPRRARSALRRNRGQVEPRVNPPPVPLNVETGIYEDDDGLAAADDGPTMEPVLKPEEEEGRSGEADAGKKSDGEEGTPGDAEPVRKSDGDEGTPGEADAVGADAEVPADDGEREI
jgi:hypothetical protein